MGGTPRPRSMSNADKYKKCPIWALVHGLEGKTVGASDRCNPGCHLFLKEAADCVFKVIGRGVNDAHIPST